MVSVLNTVILERMLSPKRGRKSDVIRKVKEELLEHYARARHCDIAELSAIVHMCGAFGVGYKGVCCLKVHTENLGVARKCFTLLEKRLI